MDVYGVSKWTNEVQLRQFRQHTGISCIGARLFNVYGFNETNPHVIPAILDQLTQDGEIRLGNIEPYRDFVYVRDVAQALIALAKAEGIDNGLYNVGTGKEWSIRELVKTCEEIVDRPLKIRSVESRRRPTDRWHLLADISRIKEEIGWQPQYDLRKGLEETILGMYSES
jgi:UDP-glucose 4-epimerase